MADIRQFPNRGFKSMDPERARQQAEREIVCDQVQPSEVPLLPTQAVAAVAVVQALRFYARGGVDRGAAAMKALILMTDEIEANHQTT